MKKPKSENSEISQKSDFSGISKKFQSNIALISDSSAVIISEIDSISLIVKKITSDIVNSNKSFESLKILINGLFDFLNENKKNIAKIIFLIDEIKKSADELNEIVYKTTNETINSFNLFDDLSRYSKDIADIINVVSMISEQTTLLAFNAAIEAAKAGQYGDGFAVVADEVRMLAVISDKNVKEIEALIKETSIDVQHNSELVDKLKLLTRLNKRRTEIISDSLDKMKDSLISISSIMDILENEISGSITEVNTLNAPLKTVTESAEVLLDQLNKSSLEITNLVNKVSEDTKAINMLLSMEGNSKFSESGENYNERVKITNKISSLVKTYMIGKSIRVYFNSAFLKYEDIKQPIQNLIKSSDLINQEIIRNAEMHKEVLKHTQNLNNLVGILRASDHIIYNEILEASIKEKTLYQGQMNPDKCSFGKWFNTYKPHDENEAILYSQLKEIHLEIHHLFSDVVEFMKQGRYDESNNIYISRIQPKTAIFIEKLSSLHEGILIMATGFSYTAKFVDKISKNIKEIPKPFQKIAKVVDSIDNIFVQTNMLSVNGSIEAARAGEFGKGFSFIGNDIKTLASETNENNEKIKDHLDQIFDLIDSLKKGFNEVDSLINDQNKAASSVTLSLLDTEKALISSSGLYSDLIIQLKDISKQALQFIDFSKNIEKEITDLTDKFDYANEQMRSYISKISKVEHTLEGIQWQFFNE
jgi:methyl-accepting chemotaxis protein